MNILEASKTENSQARLEKQKHSHLEFTCISRIIILHLLNNFTFGIINIKYADLNVF